MRRECRERFPHHRLQRKTLVSDPGVHDARAVKLTRCGMENFPGIPGACATRNFTYVVRPMVWNLSHKLVIVVVIFSEENKWLYNRSNLRPFTSIYPKYKSQLRLDHTFIRLDYTYWQGTRDEKHRANSLSSQGTGLPPVTPATARPLSASPLE